MSDQVTTELRLEFEQLIVQMFNENLTASEDARLMEIVASSPELRQLYVDQILSDTLLRWTYADCSEAAAELIPDFALEAPVELAPSQTLVSVKREFRSWYGAVASIAVLLAVAFCAVFLWPTRDKKTAAPLLVSGPQQPAVVAMLIDSEDAVWANSIGELKYGMSFREGERLALDSGLVRLAFECGAGVTLKGPAILELRSAWKAVLHRGKLAAVVPEDARGFTVLTPDMKIVDLGTKFGAEVDATGQAKVQVYEGEVTVRSRKAPEAEESLLLSSKVRSHYSQSPADFTDIHLASVDSSDVVSLPSLEQLQLVRTGQYPPAIQSMPLSEALSRLGASSASDQPSNFSQAWLAEDFSPFQHADSGREGLHPWIVDGKFARVTLLDTPLRWQSISGDPYVIEMDGRDPAFPSLCNRLETRLPGRIAQDFYFSFLGRYQGLDPNDFFALWFDNSLDVGVSHSAKPNAGIRFGEYFARAKLDHQDGRPVMGNDVRFFLVGRVRKSSKGKFNHLELWINPDVESIGPPDLQVKLPPEQGAASLSTLGFRMGKDTEPQDKLWIDRLLIDFSLQNVLQARPSTDSSPNPPAISPK
ncbi:FecR family protein [Blastopirellula sp. J2-11]|uniref:FecR family protein n=1 Tax=Blastopirellula sp. J2-11 TaxID=2943192 RepID=UPI0021CA6D44|nr:FecR family protein [Blastopirellula sp. J2-11]UUO07198.1 FecR family protein [Blastopirellula sp. J2-11]